MMITQMFNVCHHDQNDTTKTFSIANHSEVPFKQFTSVNFFSSKETKPRYFVITFVVAGINYIILGAPFFDKYVQNINIKGYTINFKYSFKDQPTIAFYTRSIEKDFAFFSFFSDKNLIKSTYIKRNTVQTFHFPLKNSKNLLLKT